MRRPVSLFPVGNAAPFTAVPSTAIRLSLGQLPNSPTTAGVGGASHGCFWAPGAYVSPGVFADQPILNGQGNGTTYGLMGARLQ